MPSFLLDSHSLLWACAGSSRLSAKARGLIEDPKHRIIVSQATVWELSIKVTIGKLELPEEFFQALPELGYEILDIRQEHLGTYRQLPLKHRDPFNRILVAQAMVEDVAIITRDAEIGAYGLRTVW